MRSLFVKALARMGCAYRNSYGTVLLPGNKPEVKAFAGVTLQPSYRNTTMYHSYNADEQLLKAIRQNDSTAVAEVLASGADIEARNADGKTPLLFALSLRSLDAAAALIVAGADVNAQDLVADSPFLYAGAEGLTSIVRQCMQAGADYRVYNRYGGSALIPACERGHVDTVAAILEDRLFPVDHINRLGWTGLLEAVILGHGGPTYVRIAGMLIEAGADVNLPDKDGITALQHARDKGQKEMAQLLERAGGA